MQTIGIICEYNPFHNGHLLHLEKIKEKFPDSLIVLVLNGYFLERGEVSIISKQNKTYLALLNGIDLVVELPFVFGSQSADIFANMAISILEKLKCDYVIFGSESDDLETLNKICDYSLNEKDNYNKKVKEYLDLGLNYPTALAKALNTNFSFKSNDLLGISYIKSIKINHYKIKPLTIKRTNDYLDTSLNSNIISALNIREKLNNNTDISNFVPKSTLSFIENITLNNYFPYIKYKILTDHDLEKYLDVDEGIQNRLIKVINNVNDVDELINQTKSKRYTYNKIRRMLTHILIGLTKEDAKNLKLNYIHVLGFNKLGKSYLNKIKKEIDFPLVINKKDKVYEYEIKCALLYDMFSKYDNTTFEISNKPIKIDK